MDTISKIKLNLILKNYSPLEIFNIKYFFNLNFGLFDFSISNSSLYLLISSLLPILIFYLYFNNKIIINK